jgi:tetratricopeptide (TPR) repeat protein
MGKHLKRGITLTELRRYRDAVDAFSAELREEPDSAIALALRSAAWFHIGRIRNAEKDVRESLRIDPDCAYAHYILSFVYAKRGQFVAAETSIRELLRLEPRSYFFSHLAELHRNQGRYHESLETVERALVRDLLSHNPEMPAVHLAIGSLTLVDGRTTDAIDHLQQARRLSPVLHNDREALGAAYGRLVWPLRWIDCTIAPVRISTLLIAATYTVSDFRLITIPLLLATFNIAAIVTTFDSICWAVGKIRFRKDLDIPAFLLQPELYTVMWQLALHIFVSLLALVGALIPWCAVCLLGILPSVEPIVSVLRTCSQWFGLVLFTLVILVIIIPIFVGAVFLVDAKLPIEAIGCWIFSLAFSCLLTAYAR